MYIYTYISPFSVLQVHDHDANRRKHAGLPVAAQGGA
jgi:hypothetical protein